ncbi:MAG: dual specificity protein phosphatase family protein, partial [Acidimicrobiia bacterium]
DLTEPGSPGDGYRSILEAGSSGATVERFPIVDFGTPSVGQEEAILEAIDRCLDQQRTVYVHCLGGLGRTGTVIGCWLIRHGLAGPDTAVATLAQLRASIDGGAARSPETDDQRRFVESWPR